MPTCPHCGFESGATAEECPLCGTRLAALADDRDPHGPVPWEDPAAAFPRSLFGTWRESLFQPTTFFRRLNYAESLARPLLYYLIVSIVSAFFVLLWRSSDSYLVPEALGPEAGLTPLVQFFMEPFAALIGLAVAVLVLQLFAALLAPERRGLRATSRVFCYSWGPAVLTAIPLLGPALGLVWSVVLLVIGTREAHRTTSGRAAAIVLLPLAGLLTTLILLTALLIMAGLASGELLRW